MLDFATKHNDPEKKLGWGERLGYGVGATGWNMINGIIGTFLTVYFTNVALLDGHGRKFCVGVFRQRSRMTL